MPCAYPYFLDILDMKKKSKYRIRKNELRRFEKENKLTKKEKERLHMWVDAVIVRMIYSGCTNCVRKKSLMNY